SGFERAGHFGLRSAAILAARTAGGQDGRGPSAAHFFFSSLPPPFSPVMIANLITRSSGLALAAEIARGRNSFSVTRSPAFRSVRSMAKPVAQDGFLSLSSSSLLGARLRPLSSKNGGGSLRRAKPPSAY